MIGSVLSTFLITMLGIPFLFPKQNVSWAFRVNTRDQIAAQISALRARNVRLLGSKPGPGVPPGEIYIENKQRLVDINLSQLHDTIYKIRNMLGYPTYDVALFLVTSKEMQETNRQTRGVNAPTDILSFPFHGSSQPGQLLEPEFDFPDYYNLGDLIVDAAYVQRRCREDQEDPNNDDDDDDAEDRGVSKAMAKVFDTHERVNMLLVHGMLHLVGYDHETDSDFEIMARAEEQMLQALNLLPKGFSGFDG